MPRFSGIFDRGALNLFCNAYDHATSLAAGVDTGVGLAHLREGVAPVDDKPQCSGFRKFGQVPNIFGPFFRRARDHPFCCRSSTPTARQAGHAGPLRSCHWSRSIASTPLPALTYRPAGECLSLGSCAVDTTISFLATPMARCFVRHEFRARIFRRDTISRRLTRFR